MAKEITLIVREPGVKGGTFMLFVSTGCGKPCVSYSEINEDAEIEFLRG
jgi:hypothetical protein